MSRYNHGGDRMNSYSQYNFKNNDDRGGGRRNQYRNAEEPEWFSGGPTSQNDTIELRGFEEYSSGGRQDDSPSSPHPSDDGNDDKVGTAADYDSDTPDKVNDDGEKLNANDDNNNDNDKSGKDGSAINHRESNATDKNTTSNNDFDADDLEVAESKSHKKDDNFNFEDFLKGDNLTDLLAVSFAMKFENGRNGFLFEIFFVCVSISVIGW